MDGLKKFGLSLLILVGMFIPVYVFLGVNSYFDPQTFWEKAAMVALGWFGLGGLQIWFLVLGVLGIIKTWDD